MTTDPTKKQGAQESSFKEPPKQGNPFSFSQNDIAENLNPNITISWEDLVKKAGLLPQGGRMSNDYETAKKLAQSKGQLETLKKYIQAYSADPDPVLTGVANAQKRQSDFFDQNLDYFRKQLMDGVIANQRRALAMNDTQTARGVNRRGLLFSGIHEAGRGKNRSDFASNVEQGRVDTNAGLNSLSDAFRQAPINTALAAKGQSQGALSTGMNASQQSMLDALKQRNMNNQGYADFFSGVAKIPAMSAAGR